MSGGVIDECMSGRPAGDDETVGAGARGVCDVAAQSGVGMLEFLVALLVFSLGMTGLLSAQLVGKKTSFDASQRSVATALARDMLERMRANPGQITAYQVAGLGDEARRLALPDTDCDATACTAGQLAVFDLWQWESLLLGESARDAVGNAGGLVAPRACITAVAGEVGVTISWRGVMRGVTTVEPVAAGCDGGGDDVPVDGQGDGAQRQQLTVSTFIAES